MTQTTAPAEVRTSGWDRWARRWVSVGGLVTVVGIGNLVAALNWNAIAKGTQDPGAFAASDRYALWGFAFLVVGQAMVTRSAFTDARRAPSDLDAPSPARAPRSGRLDRA
ncbi:hypothetical protein [Cellulomonas biazotea]|uniref:Uncharacterized protein n=1 Tax=Cellulomonas biazotea TaxID=1709 RepID=A0A402DS30_9CELL|nr:hypothetical protein [Cellulomonas biazotea]GCE76932.1 hypothetical protein CBZ_19880 [Cellulomonas biazotea]